MPFEIQVAALHTIVVHSSSTHEHSIAWSVFAAASLKQFLKHPVQLGPQIIISPYFLILSFKTAVGTLRETTRTQKVQMVNFCS